MRRLTSTPPELPGYTFVKLLGSGGFSDVFLYEQQLPRRRVAVKVLITEELTSANRAAFAAEANLMAQLSTHPYIVTIYQADVASDDRPYFVMEYCSGPSLSERYKQETLSVADALRTGVRLSSAVATAHSAGILHRDIKPANVLTNDYGWPALTDFGISSAVEEDPLPITTSTLADLAAGATGGTGQSIGMSVPWSPPEMFEDDPQPDVRSDVFSLAATIYTILAGHTPFEVRGHSNGALDLIGRIERGAITPMQRTDLPRSLLAVLQKGMASDRADRFATAVDFARALQRVELELGYAPTTIDVPNLFVEAPQRGQDDDEDATRARSVATIEAQPAPVILPPLVGPEHSASPLIERPAPDADETQVRGAQRIEAQPVAPSPASELPAETVVRARVTTPPPPAPPEPAPTAPKPPASRRNRVIAIVAVIVVLAIAAAVVIGVVFSGAAGQTPKPTASSTAGGGSAVIETTPTPIVGAAPTFSSGSVTFSFTNPKPKSGDQFHWRISNRGDSEPSHVSATGVITVEGYTTGSTLCVEATIVRDGKESDPLNSCYPQ
jgi:serine/threonine protein kinase